MATMIGVAITGLAGPDKDDTSETSVGTCWFSWYFNDGSLETRCEHFNGDRTSVNSQAVDKALAGLIEILQQNM